MKCNDPTVLVRECGEYDRAALRDIIDSGMKELGYAPSGNVFVKPNGVFAFDPTIYGKDAWTNSALVGAALEAVAGRSAVNRVDLGENSAVGMPTRLTYKYSGYFEEVRRVNSISQARVDAVCIDEEPRESVFIGGRVHDNLRINRKMARADSLVYLPKLKCHCVSNMTSTVKLNVGICCDDERSIRHDFLLNEKIVDLLSAGYPDFTAVDAITVGVGNEAMPFPRKLGLVVMGLNPLAVDLVCARLLGFGLEDIPYLKAAAERGHRPDKLEDVAVKGDLSSIEDLDEAAKRIMPYNDEYTRWQDVSKELKRLNSPMRFYWGPYRGGGEEKCLTGCVMGLKMFLAFFENFAGPEAFQKAKPVAFVIGQVDEQVDGRGAEVFLIGSCAKADIVNAKRVTRLDKCFTTAGDMMQTISYKLGMPSPFLDKSFIKPYAAAASGAIFRKTFNGRYLQDIGHFLAKGLIRRL